jgi:thiol-disulfide isomerase/thioredoxin
LWLERVLTTGTGGRTFLLAAGAAVLAILLFAVVRRWEKITSMRGNKTIFAIITVIALIIGTYYADKATRVKPRSTDSGTVQASDKGQLAPAVTFKNLDGADVTLAQYKGTVVLVNFWATWCDPCYVEIPWLIEMQQKYAAKGFTILGVSMDEEGKAAVVPFLAKERFNVNGQKLPMNYPIVIGNDDVADKFGGLLGYPTSFLISKDGKIVKKVQGLISYEELTKAIEAQL